MTKKASATRAPKPPPFPVGTKLVCVTKERGASYIAAVRSPRDIKQHPEDWIQVSGAGLEVEIAEVQRGRPGTGRQLVDEDGPMYYEDTGEPILDETRDGTSIFYVTDASGEKHGRLIHYKNRRDWKRR